MKEVSEILLHKKSQLIKLLKRLAMTLEIPLEDVQLVSDLTNKNYICLNFPINSTKINEVFNILNARKLAVQVIENRLKITHLDIGLLDGNNQDVARAGSKRKFDFFEPSQSLCDCFAHIYRRELKDNSAENNHHQIMVSKFADLLLLEKLEEMINQQNIKLSYYGRTIYKIDPAHNHLFKSVNFDNIHLSRLHFAVIEAATGERVIIDLGSSSGISISYLDDITECDYEQTHTWMSKLHQAALQSLGIELSGNETVNNNSLLKDYSKICPQYQVILKESFEYLKISNLLSKPQKNGSIVLKPYTGALNWAPIPKHYAYTVQLGNVILDFTPEMSFEQVVPNVSLQLPS